MSHPFTTSNGGRASGECNCNSQLAHLATLILPNQLIQHTKPLPKRPLAPAWGQGATGSYASYSLISKLPSQPDQLVVQ